MPEPLSMASRINMISDQFDVPRSVIENAINLDIITTVGYAGQIVIDAVDVIRVVQTYKKGLHT